MVSICNLVGEFNGLVSTEGSAFAGPLVFLEVQRRYGLWVLRCGLWVSQFQNL